MDQLKDLRELCLDIIVVLANEYAKKLKDTQNKSSKELTWPIRRIPKADFLYIASRLSVDLPLKNIWAWKLPGVYWKRRLLCHFPSLHARPLVTTVHPNPEAYSKKSDDHMRSNTKKETNLVIQPKEKHQIPDVNYVQLDRDPLSHYLEELLGKCFEMKNFQGLEELLSLGASHISTLRLHRIHLPEIDAKPNKLSDPAYVSSQLPNLKTIELRFIPASHSALTQIPSEMITTLGSTISPSITSICLYEANLTDGLVGSLLDSVPDLPNLQCLDLRHNILTCDSCAYLKDIMATTPLKELQLTHNKIGFTGACVLALGIKHSKTISIVSLDLNRIKDKGAIEILKIATSTNPLRFLSLSGCQITGESDNFWKYLRSYWNQMEHDQYISLAGNEFTEEMMTKAAEEFTSKNKGNMVLSSMDSTTSVDVRAHPMDSPSYFADRSRHHLVQLQNSPEEINLKPDVTPGIIHSSFLLEKKLRDTCFHLSGKSTIM